MGRNQHSKDRLYITQTEWKYLYGGKKDKFEQIRQNVPFDHCALTFRPWQHPCCAADGSVFELLAIVPYIKKYKKHPITGKKLSAKEIKKLTYAKNHAGKYHCPVTMKIFTNHSHIMANRKSGNVYSREAVKELNIKAKNWTDLLTGEPFQQSDLVTLQDPQSARKRVILDCAKVAEAINQRGRRSEKSKGERTNVRANAATKRIFDAMDKSTKASGGGKGPATHASKRPRSKFTSGACSGGFTSTAMTPVTQNEKAFASKAELAEARNTRVRQLGKKGYVRLQTTKGDLNIELHCNIVPRTCDNFMQLCKSGYYDGVAFHRIIKSFMVQGGDPTGTGSGGESCWGKPFKDEFSSRLTHDKRGVLSMANSGPDTNKSQFFITFKSCHHLDNVHSVFGRIVGGLPILRAIETVEVSKKKDKPKERVEIISATVFVDPFAEAEAMLEQMDAKEKAKGAKGDVVKQVDGKWQVHAFNAYDGAVAEPALLASSKVGKYLAAKKPASKRATKIAVTKLEEQPPAYRLKKKPKKTIYKDFSGW